MRHSISFSSWFWLFIIVLIARYLFTDIGFYTKMFFQVSETDVIYIYVSTFCEKGPYVLGYYGVSVKNCIEIKPMTSLVKLSIAQLHAKGWCLKEMHHVKYQHYNVNLLDIKI